MLASKGDETLKRVAARFERNVGISADIPLIEACASITEADRQNVRFLAQAAILEEDPEDLDLVPLIMDCFSWSRTAEAQRIIVLWTGTHERAPEGGLASKMPMDAKSRSHITASRCLPLCLDL